jgi:hypothetical protein
MSQLYGVHYGIQIGQHDRVDELNERIVNRLEPNNMQPNFDPRPVSTKYALFPMADRRVLETPGRIFGPKTITRDVDTEGTIRGLDHRIYSKDSDAKFIPGLGSDMYKGYVPTDTTVPAEHALLFKKQVFEKSVHPNLMSSQVGLEMFHNHTRTQLRNLP